MTIVPGRLGRSGFFVGFAAVYAVIFFLLPIFLMLGAMRAWPPLALAAIGAVCVWWFVLHARRLSDAGRGQGGALIVSLILFGLLAVGYGGLAGWFGPEVQPRDFAFGRTMEQGSSRFGLPDWFHPTLYAWWDFAGPLARGVGMWVLFGLSKAAIGLIGLYSLLTLARGSFGTPPALSRPVRPAIRWPGNVAK